MRALALSAAGMALCATLFTSGGLLPVEAASLSTYQETSTVSPSAAVTSPLTVVGPPGGTNPSCQHFDAAGNNGWSTYSSQVSPTPTLAWGYNVTSSGATAVNGAPSGYVTVWLSSGSVWDPNNGQTYNLNVGQLYGKHTEPWDYQFHGSVSKWPLQGGTSLPVENGDLMTFYFTTSGLFGQFTDGPISCMVEQ